MSLMETDPSNVRNHEFHRQDNDVRWLEIDITNPPAPAADLLSAVRDRQSELPRLQTDEGLDSPAIVRFFEEQGQLLFRAIQTQLSEILGDDDTATVGIRIVTTSFHLALPWHCLHNGLDFLLEKTPICAELAQPDGGTTGPALTWRHRWQETQLTESALGPAAAHEIARRYRPQPCAEPEILFVNGRSSPGHDDANRREQELLDTALETTCGSLRLGRLTTPTIQPTPAYLMKRGPYYQAIHFADSTMHASAAGGTTAGLAWNRGFEPPEADKEVLGVDPITALLDDIVERVEQPMRAESSLQTTTAVAAWELEDGPVRPEDLGRHEAIPPLVFSNSYLSVSTLGERFLTAGSAVFVGTQALVAPAAAREFAASFYRALACGCCVASALRKASLQARDERGAHHPLWLCYGAVGAGHLALQYL